MPRFIHLSDVHLHESTYEEVLTALERGLSHATLSRVRAVFLSGDLFDSVDVDQAQGQQMLSSLVRAIRKPLGDPSILVIPGNHDRRIAGVLGPNHFGLILSISNANSANGLIIAGTSRHEFAKVQSLAGVPAIVVAHDSTYLPSGAFSAGGTARTEDILQIASHIKNEPQDLPLIWVMHHHLVPTPVTDLGRVCISERNRLEKAGIRALRYFVPYGDCEEIFMTAMGAGSALSMLHNFHRAVIVLHGHKHYPTARLLKGTMDGEGDLAIISAGSAGLAEPWTTTTSPEPMRLWPSFNVIDLEEDRLTVEVVAFPPDGTNKPLARRRIFEAQRNGMKWEPSHIPPHDIPIAMNENVAEYALIAGARHDEYDFKCTRTLKFASLPGLCSVHEDVEGLPHGSLESDGKRSPLPTSIELFEGTSNYFIRRAACKTHQRASLVYDEETFFEWVGLPNRYGAAMATLSLEADQQVIDSAFGSVTDLTTGREIPIPVERKDGVVTLATPGPCAARSLLRIYWPLA